MTDYRVTWTIDIFDADSPEDAAQQALNTQRNPYSQAVVFEVIDPKTEEIVEVDLMALKP